MKNNIDRYEYEGCQSAELEVHYIIFCKVKNETFFNVVSLSGWSINNVVICCNDALQHINWIVYIIEFFSKCQEIALYLY